MAQMFLGIMPFHTQKLFDGFKLQFKEEYSHDYCHYCCYYLYVCMQANSHTLVCIKMRDPHVLLFKRMHTNETESERVLV